MNTDNDKVTVGYGTGKETSSTWHCPYTPPKVEQGWECPRCGRINAPWVRQCDCSRNDKWEKWDITWNRDDCTKPWWYDYKITCAPETTQETPSSVCGSDSTTKQNPNSTIYTTAHNPVVGGSDYWDNMSQTWSNMPNVSNSSTSVDSAWNSTNPNNCHTPHYTAETVVNNDLEPLIRHFKD